MKVLVTGGTGFLGANLVRAHLAMGDEVRCLIRPTSRTFTLDGLPIEVERGLLSDREFLRKAVKGCDGIQHVAGTYDTGPEGVSRMHAAHVEATRNLCETALELGVGRVVICSSSITIGFGPKQAPGNEDTPVADPDVHYPPGTALGAYYDSKLRAEAIAAEYAAKGLGVVVVNPDHVVGAWDIKPTSGALILAMARRWIPFYPRGGKCFITAQDCAQAMVFALERGRPGQRYLLGNENLSYHQYMNLVARVIGVPPPAVPIPRTLTKASFRTAEMISERFRELFTNIDLPVLASMQQERYRDGRKAREELGMPRTPLAWGIEAAWRWFRDNGYVKERTSLFRWFGG